MTSRPAHASPRYLGAVIFALLLAGVAVALWVGSRPAPSGESKTPPPKPAYKPRLMVDPNGYSIAITEVPPWRADASLEEVAQSWRKVGARLREKTEARLALPSLSPDDRLHAITAKVSLLNYDAETEKAYAVLEEARRLVEGDAALAEEWLYTVVYLQGLTSLRRGENENCILCRGESSCILPIVPAAIHANAGGSRLAIKHFTEYLEAFPDDLEVKWLLNVAHMTLGEHPNGVDPRFRLSLDRYNSPEHAIGKFRDVGHLVGVATLGQAGGTIMDDFDNDGRLDIVFTCWDATQPMAFYRNRGDGKFDDRTREAGLLDQLGGMYCVQADYDNDGFTDVFITRGAWLNTPIRPSLLRNNGNGTFTDVTREAGLLDPGNSISAQWADYDNDGRLDLFVCREKGPNCLYHNRGNGTFEEVAWKAGVEGRGGVWKGAAWIDYDNDAYPDLFLTNYVGTAKLFRNNRDGGFTEVTREMGVEEPHKGFSCWAWDYDNDGWLDVFATSYDHNVAEVVKGVIGQPHKAYTSKLYRNAGGKRFEDVTNAAGLDACFATMGSNFADFDNDGYLDFYLGTGNPDIALLVPNRMFRNLGGRRFAEITGSSGTGNLQKGHAVACGDWDRNGTVDIAIEMGGASPGDVYHNVLFQNPGQGNHWLNVKLVGKKTNRSAIGARIKVVTAGENPLTVHRHVSSGSSFGANPLEQVIGLGKAEKIALLEVHWPTSGTTQVFRDIPADRAIEITEFAADFQPRDYKPIPLPK